MRLTYMPGACSLAPHIALEWIGNPYEAVRVSREEIHGAAYMELNPLGKVPTFFAEDGTLMVEVSAILNYLVEKYPQAELGYGKTPEERYQLFRWLSHFSANVHPAFGPLFAPQRYLDDPALHEQVRRAAFARVADALRFLDDAMEGRDHILGGKRTVLDPYLYVFCRWGRNLLEGGLAPFSNLERFFRQMSQDAGVAAVLRQQGLQP